MFCYCLFSTFHQGTDFQALRPPRPQPLIAVGDQCHQLIFLSWNSDWSALHKSFSTSVIRPQKSSGFTSGDPPSALTCGTRHTVPTGELHIGELGDVPALPVLTVAVLQRRCQAVSSLPLAAVRVELGKRLPHNHICQHRNTSAGIPDRWGKTALQMQRKSGFATVVMVWVFKYSLISS